MGKYFTSLRFYEEMSWFLVSITTQKEFKE